MQVRRTSVVRKPRRFRLERPQFVLKPELWRTFPSRIKSEHVVPRFRNPRQVASYVLIFIGTVLCTYVAGTYLWMYAQQKIMLGQWGKRDASNPPLTKLSIPKIHLEDVVLEGASSHSLLLGPAHLSETAIPGTLGNAVIAGHRDTFFRHVHSLRYGDDIYILRGGRLFHYVVRSRRIVEPTNLSVLRSTKDGELTLITCYPTHAIGPAPQRLIIVAKLVSEPALSAPTLAKNVGIGAKLQYLLK
jgi:sortase A